MANHNERGRLIKCMLPCPLENCGSSDAVAKYKKLSGEIDYFCWSCRRPFKEDKSPGESSNKLEIADVLMLPFVNLPERRISKDTCETYGVREFAHEPRTRFYPAYKFGRLSGFRVRTLPKDFSGKVGDVEGELELFGQHIWPGKMSLCIVTCGEEDAMAAYQITKMFSKHGKGYCCVSLPSGTNLNAVKNNILWLDQHDKIIFAVDQEEKDVKMAREAALMLIPGKGYIARFSEKDASDMLKMGKEQEFFDAINKAVQVIPSGVVKGSDTWDRWINKPEVPSVPFPKGWKLTELTYGMRMGELDIWTSGAGMGKSSFMRTIAYHLLKTTKDNIGLIFLEEPIEDTVGELISLELGKRIRLPDVESNIEEQRAAWEAVFGDNRLYLEDTFGDMTESTLIARIRYLAKGFGCKYVVLDHLSIAISGNAEGESEREKIDTLMLALKKLTQELKIWIGLVIHLRKTTVGMDTFEEGGAPSLDDLKGSSTPKQLANSVYTLIRNQQDEEHRSEVQIFVLKCRFTGRTGYGGTYLYDEKTGRINPKQAFGAVDASEEDM